MIDSDSSEGELPLVFFLSARFPFFFPGAMTASALAAITTFEVVGLSEDNISLRCEVVVFFSKFVGEGHFLVVDFGRINSSDLIPVAYEGPYFCVHQ
jgi:hypothetical protein